MNRVAERLSWSELEHFIDGQLDRGGGRVGGRPRDGLLDGRGAALAARGEFNAARQVYDELRQTSVEDGMLLSLISNIAQESAEVELRAREWTAAESILREAWDGLGVAAEGGFRSTIGTMLATALVAQERLDEAATNVAECEQMTRDDYVTHAGVELVRARIASARAQHDEAGLMPTRPSSSSAQPTPWSSWQMPTSSSARHCWLRSVARRRLSRSRQLKRTRCRRGRSCWPPTRASCSTEGRLAEAPQPTATAG